MEVKQLGCSGNAKPSTGLGHVQEDRWMARGGEAVNRFAGGCATLVDDGGPPSMANLLKPMAFMHACK